MVHADSRYKLGDVVLYNRNRYRVTAVRRITTSIPYAIWNYEYDLLLLREPRLGERSVIKGVNEYEMSRKVDDIYEDHLKKVHDDMIDSLLHSIPTFYEKSDRIKEEMNAMFGVPKFEYKKIIFNGPCTIILWKDGTKTIAKASDGEMFDPEKGVAICFMKRALGETEGKKVLRKASKHYEDYLTENGIYPTLDPKDLHALKPTEYRLYFDNHIAHVSDINPNSAIRIDQSTIEEIKKIEEEQDDN